MPILGSLLLPKYQLVKAAQQLQTQAFSASVMQHSQKSYLLSSYRQPRPATGSSFNPPSLFTMDADDLAASIDHATQGSYGVATGFELQPIDPTVDDPLGNADESVLTESRCPEDFKVVKVDGLKARREYPSVCSEMRYLFGYLDSAMTLALYRAEG